ncbi:MAG TPA: hypothetical protein PL191_01175 [Candidatus Saccharimonas sp.]|nr:hypothetical protein [Candidatus Saccharimonas sp.]
MKASTGNTNTSSTPQLTHSKALIRTVAIYGVLFSGWLFLQLHR